jgi:hypothetical protein
MSSASRRTIIKALVRGIFASLTGVPRMLCKRQQIMRTRKIPMSAMAQLLRRHRLYFREVLAND